MSGRRLLNDPLYACNILPLVFRHLKQKDIHKCARVCQLWHGIVIDYGINTSVRLCRIHKNFKFLIQNLEKFGTRHLSLDNALCCSLDENIEFQASLPQLITLDFKDCCISKINFLIYISPNLENINASFSYPYRRGHSVCAKQKYYLYDNALLQWRYSEVLQCNSSIANFCHLRGTIESVKSLTIKSCSDITEECGELMQSCVNLTKLKLKNVQSWNPTQLLSISNLTTLHLIGFHVPNDFEEILFQCKHLKNLFLVPFCAKTLQTTRDYNTIILKCVHRLANRLTSFIWGFSISYLIIVDGMYENYIWLNGNGQANARLNHIDSIPINLDISSPDPALEVKMVTIQLLEQHLRQQNWSTSVRVCKKDI
ncbi:hypothetical protein ABEB36_003496 [Hypothenemus hampei]|uniref:F-box domain-containing protein n=1 Tax=Hypothenemus hampei TaxID=57062 RepID=A0ABD1F9C8_HYPHA